MSNFDNKMEELNKWVGPIPTREIVLVISLLKEDFENQIQKLKKEGKEDEDEV